MKYKLATLTTILAGCLATVSGAQVADLYVRSDGTGSLGESWSDAFGSLQVAIDAAEENDVIWVAWISGTPPGAYVLPLDGSSHVPIAINKNVKIYGGFQVDDTDFLDRDVVQYETIITADVDADDNYTAAFPANHNTSAVFTTISNNVDQVVIFDGTDLGTDGALFNGFTVRGARKHGVSCADGNDPGDGTLQECLITYCCGNAAGGGVLIDGSEVEIRECHIVSNRRVGVETSDADLGILDCTIEKTYGPGIRSTDTVLDVVSSRLIQNDGSGAEVVAAPDVRFIGCLIVKNGLSTITEVNPSAFTGGLEFGLVTGDVVEIINCTIMDNEGRPLTPTPTSLDNEGVGGIRIAEPSGSTDVSDVYIQNTILYDNIGSFDGTGDDEMLSQFYFLGTFVSEEYQTTVYIEYADIAGYADLVDYWDPLVFFVLGDGIDDYDPGLVQYRPISTSPVVDAGDNGLNPADSRDADNDTSLTEPTPDANAANRPSGGEIEIGAFELCLADFNDDGIVGPDDLAALLAEWGCTSSCDTDLDDDDDVDAADLAILLANWACGVYEGRVADDIVESLAAYGLTEANWIAFVNAISGEDEDCYICWLHHYILECEPFCTTSCTMCSDPFGGH